MAEEAKNDIPEFTDADGNPLTEEALRELSNGKGGDENGDQ